MEPIKTSFKIGDRVCCPDEYGPEILEVVKINRFDEKWLWCRCEWWPPHWKPDLFHISQLITPVNSRSRYFSEICHRERDRLRLGF
jgi:hypothetical protein